jgi:hypothetical protein
MFVLIEIADFTAIGALVMGVPESIGLLVFGVGLTTTAILIRRFLGRGDAEKTGDDRRSKL